MEVMDSRFDLVLTATTLMTQALANANQEGKTLQACGLVSDPFSAGIGVSREKPLAHPKHLVGIGTMQPMAASFRLAKTLFPGLKRVSVV